MLNDKCAVRLLDCSHQTSLYMTAQLTSKIIIPSLDRSIYQLGGLVVECQFQDWWFVGLEPQLGNSKDFKMVPTAPLLGTQ